VSASAVCVALIASACGGSSRHTSAPTATSSTTAPTVTVRTATSRTPPAPPTPAAIERAAALTASRSGFAARVSARIGLPQFGGNALTAIGSGHFDPRSSSGTLDIAVQLPGLLGLAGPLPTQVRLVGGQAYVQVPSDLAAELGSSGGWLQDSIAALGLGEALGPRDILREVARDATRHIIGQRARVTIDPSTGLVRTIVLGYVAAGGYRVHVRLTLTGFARQPATAAPPPAATADLHSSLSRLGF
jgi:hypothetical protein